MHIEFLCDATDARRERPTYVVPLPCVHTARSEMIGHRAIVRLTSSFMVLLQASVGKEMTINGKWETPQMTDEDVQGQDVPQYLACDACRAVVGHANQALRRAESERGGKQLSEAAAIEVLEERVCQFNRKKLLDVDPDSFWHEYGVKLVDGGARQGEKVLDGDAVRLSPYNNAL